MKISRQEESEIPEFPDRDSARKYFKNKYGDDFMLTSSEVIDGRKIYFYALILDWEVFEDGQNKMRKGEILKGLDFINSYQSIEIFEDGMIHIIH